MHAAAGELALELGRFEQARVHLRRALAMQPQFASGWLRLAAAHRFQQLDEADARLIERALALVMLAAPAGRARQVARNALMLGMLLFCGSLYALALGAPRWIGLITPFGGVALIIGWLALGAACLRRQG